MNGRGEWCAELTPGPSGTRCRACSSTTTACGGACRTRPSPTTRRSPHPRSSATPSTRGDIVGTERVDDDRRCRASGPRCSGTIASTCCRTRTSGRSRCCATPRSLQLALTRGALAEKLITKDASSYNVQFVGTKPVFIDVGSFERLRGGEPWPGYRQFCELFLNPLLVQALRDVPFQPLLRGSIHGISPDDRGRPAARRRALHEGRVHPRQVARQGRAQVRRRRPRARRQGRTAAGRVRSRADRRPAEEPREGDHRAEVGASRTRRGRTTPTGRTTTTRICGAKERFVAAAVEARSPGRVLDLGANDGHFSRLALAGRRGVRRRRRLRRSRRRSPVPRPPARG